MTGSNWKISSGAARSMSARFRFARSSTNAAAGPMTMPASRVMFPPTGFGTKKRTTHVTP